VEGTLASYWLMLKWMISQWWFWVAYVFVSIGLLYCWWRIFERRVYKLINGELYVKEGLKDWEKLDEHMKREHPVEWRKLHKNG
jgi:hypothetical protein